jgi:ankyrin repeat protein
MLNSPTGNESPGAGQQHGLPLFLAMSASTSETDNAVGTMQRASRDLDTNFAAMNINSGTGVQSNYIQTGTQNTQYNAESQTFYNTTQPLPEKEKIAECQNALLAIRPEDHRAAIINTKGKRVTGTCEWILNDAGFQSLLSGETRLLCIQGGPGKGKTMLSIYLTQELERTNKVIYFFCQADDEARRSATYVLRSLIWQLTVQHPALAYHLTQYMYPPDHKQPVLTSKETLWSIFVNITDDPGFIGSFCLLDGLDECDDETQRWLAMKLTDLCKAQEQMPGASCMRILVVSRPGVLALRASKRIVLDPDHSDQISHDIGAFVKAKVQDLSSQLESLSDDARAKFEDKMQSELLTRAQGTFLWVGFAVMELLRKLTRTQMEDAIQELPVGLTAMYDRMLLQIDSRHRATCAKVLRWISFAMRPLSIDELQAVIGSEPSGLLSTRQSTLDCLTICGPFVTISNGKVNLVHESARDYLVLPRDPRATALECFHLQPSLVHLEMATTCLIYIEQDYRLECGNWQAVHRNFANSTWSENTPETPWHENFDQNDASSTRSEDTPENPWHRPLSAYATCHWPEHARRSGDSSERLLLVTPLFFASKSLLRERWYGMFLTATPYEYSAIFTPARYEPHGIPALHMACYLGLEFWVTKLLRPRFGFRIRSQHNRPYGDADQTPLMYAAAKGHISVVDQLLRNRAKIDAMDRDGMTALHHAVMQEHNAVTQLLLKRGATIDFGRQEKVSVLRTAVRTGNIDLVRQLLEHIANLERRSSSGVHKGNRNTPLHFSSEIGKVNVMRYLLDNGAEINARNPDQETPLHVAASRGEIEASQLLVRKGASVDARSSSGKTPLHVAAAMRYSDETLLGILLAAGADVNARSHTGQTPLHEAVVVGDLNEEAVCVLLQAGARVDARTDSGRTPLHDATRSRHSIECVVDALLNAGAEVDSLDNDGQTPLDLALRHGAFRNKHVLIVYGAKISAADKLALLQEAVDRCDGQMVTALLGRESSFLMSMPDSALGSPLHLKVAASVGRESSFLMSMTDDAGRTPLHLAVIAHNLWRYAETINSGFSRTSTERLRYANNAMREQAAIVRLLLRNGADVEAMDAYGATALHYAVEFDTEQALMVLLEHGADVDVQAGDGKTALQMARNIGNDASVHMLIEFGAQDVESVQDQPCEEPARRRGFRFFASR